ncbi:MAG: EVE domain-containing protein [Thermoflexibacteraceae bacterium]
MAEGSTFWSGVRNHQARNNLRSMLTVDSILLFHKIYSYLTRNMLILKLLFYLLMQ